MTLDAKFPRKFVLDPKKPEESFRTLLRALEWMQIEVKKAFEAEYYTANGITKKAGDSADALSDLQTMLDGNIYLLGEANGASPAMNLEIDFTGVSSISAIVVMAYYEGSASHAVRIQLYDYNIANWVTIHTMNDGVDYEQHFKTIVDDTNCISDTNAKIRLYHTESGIGAHDLYIDYVGLKR
jgi:hypothetical protein